MAEGEINFDDIINPEGGEAAAPPVEPAAEPPAEPAAEAAGEDTNEQEQSGGRANDRIRGLIDQNKELEARLAAMETVKEEVLKLRQDMTKEPETPAEETPEFMEDPKGYIDAQQKQMADQMAKLQAEAKKGDEESQMRLAELQFRQAVVGDESRFTQQHPDYLEALTHVRSIRQQELSDLGVSEQDAAVIINNEEVQAAAAALQNQKSPSEAVYNRATRLGYKAKAAEEGQLDEAAERLAAAQNATSMGGSGTPEAQIEEDPDEAAWEPIAAAFKEAWGEDLK